MSRYVADSTQGRIVDQERDAQLLGFLRDAFMYGGSLAVRTKSGLNPRQLAFWRYVVRVRIRRGAHFSDPIVIICSLPIRRISPSNAPLICAPAEIAYGAAV